MLAFQRGEETEDGLLGAIMMSEFQAYVMSWGEAWEQWVKAWVKTKRKR